MYQIIMETGLKSTEPLIQMYDKYICKKKEVMLQ